VVEGCDVVFHLATPVPENKIVDPEESLFLLDAKVLFGSIKFYKNWLLSLASKK
jgi:hypothetical protein